MKGRAPGLVVLSSRIGTKDKSPHYVQVARGKLI